MQVSFHIDYHTSWGEQVAICVDYPSLGAGVHSKATIMNIHGNSHWSLTLNIDDYIDDFVYHYIIVDNEHSILRNEDPKNKHRFVKSGEIEHVLLFDSWRQDSSDRPLVSAAFTECFFRRTQPSKPDKAIAGSILLQALSPLISPRYTLAVVGSTPSLGNWNPNEAIPLKDGKFPYWNVSVDISNDGYKEIEFKFLIIDTITGELISWEQGSNRHILLASNYTSACTVCDCGEISFDLPAWHGAGVAIPVFSIRTENDFGVGDFHSIRRMIDWCAATGLKVLQVLPINDTTMQDSWRDSYPYNANSTFALHPMYLHLPEVGTLAEPARITHYESIAKELNSLPVVDYEKVTKYKDLYARELYAQVYNSLDDDHEFTAFVSSNAEWLKPYAAFRLLRDRYRTSDMALWHEYAIYDPVRIDRLIADNPREITYHYFIQYHLHKQMRRARDYASSKGVAIKGDIPIGISRTSVDAWINPQLFNLDCQAGAPPDAFSVFGQNWGFPTYNWDKMSYDGFAWWRARFSKMSEYFHAYRIDHVLGFFRIWQIPCESIHGLLGYFNAALPLTPEEMKTCFGFSFDRELYTRPFITDNVLYELFGEFSDEVREKFLNIGEIESGYRLRSDFDTQRKVALYFANLPHDEHNHRICEGLMTLIDDVLFIEDPYHKETFHPRIAAQSTFVYKSLNDTTKVQFDYLYHDFYYVRHNDFWANQAMWKLPTLINSTNMLVCAEDLGMIPATVPEVLDQLQILSLEIQRMPKEYGKTFADPADYPYMSVCSTSTHDMSGIRQWWEEDPSLSQKFFNEILHCKGNAPVIAEPWICDKIIDMNLHSNSMLCILPLQDWLSVNKTVRRDSPADERINNPADPLQYWQYRMHITVEQLLKMDVFNDFIYSKIKAAGR